MADDDNFDIDIYGDDDAGAGQDQSGVATQDGYGVSSAGQNFGTNDAYETHGGVGSAQPEGFTATSGTTTNADDMMSAQTDSGAGQPKTESSANANMEMDESRLVDPDATKAAIIGDLQWWVTEDDIRGWARFCSTEHELVEITFNEHKVNGKCKGQVHVEFQSPQATSAFKHLLESEENPNSAKPASKKHTISYTTAGQNPFKTLPKDGPGRQAAASSAANTTPGAMRGVANSSPYERQAGFQRGRGGFRGRGNFNQGNTGGYNNNMGGGFNRGGMGMGRGGFGNRGGRGGFNGNMNGGGMMGMPNMMGGMGGMPMMPNMMGMGGFNPMQGNFNPGFFQGQQNQGGDNPHGAKRMRQDG